MKQHILIIGALSAGLAAATPAMAAGPVFYTGLSAGWNATEFEAATALTDGGNTMTTEEDLSASGAAYGGMLGVKFPISTGFVGFEVNVADSSGEYEGVETTNGTEVRAQTITSDLSFGLSGILAFNVNAHSQFYGLAGYQVTNFEDKTSTRASGSGEVTNDAYDEAIGGFRVGLGLETALTNALSARVEWSLTNYSTEDYRLATADGERATELDPTENRLSVGVIGHF